MKKHLLLFVAAIVFGNTAYADAPAMKIGYVDLQSVVTQSEHGKREIANLKKDFETKQKKLDQMQEELKKLKEGFDKQAAMLNEEARMKKQAELQQKFGELQQTYMNLQKDVGEKQQQVTSEILAKVKVIVEKIGDRDGYTLILDRNEANVLYFKRHMDVTDEVLATYNQQSKKK